MTKPIPKELISLKAMDKAMMACPPYMWKANMEYIIDKFFTHPPQYIIDLKEVTPPERGE